MEGVIADQTVIEKWWAQLSMPERVEIFDYSDDPVLHCAVVTVAQVSYSSYRREIQEIIEKTFLEGRDANEFWFGISWTFACPLRNRESRERGIIWLRSEDPQELKAFLLQ